MKCPGLADIACHVWAASVNMIAKLEIGFGSEEVAPRGQSTKVILEGFSRSQVMTLVT